MRLRDAICIVLAACTIGLAGPRAATALPSKNVVALIKYATHPALDELEDGFLQAIQTEIRSYPGLVLERYDANKRPERAKELAESVTRDDVILIVTIATPTAQAVIRTPSRIPLVYGAVADPEGAGILSEGRATGIRNVSPEIVRTAVEFIAAAMGQKVVIGSIYNPGEQNSAYVHSILRDTCTRMAIHLETIPVKDTSQLGSAAEDLLSRVDVLYSANDNTVNAGVDAVVAVCDQAQKPFVIGDLSTLAKGPLVAVGLDYHEMGVQLAQLAARVLAGAPISEIPPQNPPPPKIVLNKSVHARLGSPIPPKVLNDFHVIVR